MSKLVVLVDVDGILADFVGASLDTIQRHIGVQYRPEQVTRWDFTSLPGWENVSARYWELVRNIGFCSQIPVLPGARWGIDKLRQFADVVFVTSPMHRAPTWTHERDVWLEKHFDAHHHDVLHVRRKELVRGDVLIEDSPKNLAAWEKAWNRKGLLKRCPYNEGSAHVTVDTWDQIVQHVVALDGPR